MSSFRTLPVLGSFVLAMSAIGCGPGTYPVEGQVVYAKGGQPFPGGRVELELEDAELAKRANASTEIDAEGRFKLQAREGKHRVLILPPMPPPNVKNPQPLAPLHIKHRSYDKSELSITVTRDAKANRVKLEVEK